MFRKLAFLIIPLLLLSACNLPSGEQETATPDEQLLTAAAQTVEAELAQSEQALAGTQTAAAQATQAATPAATNTSPPTTAPTQGGADCNVVGWVADVTVPDGTEFSPGEDFTKTWRLRNDGTCAWTSGYQLIFDSGDPMGGPASQAVTAGLVNPSDTIDISVDLTAPASEGSYQGNWKFKDPSGVIFGFSDGSAWFVQIKVVGGGGGGGSGPTTSTVTLTQSSDGTVWSDGTTYNTRNVGDTSGNLGSQAFLAFDISGIPAGATIDSVAVDFSDYDVLPSGVGDPFADLGCLRAYPGSYFPLGAGDYFSGIPLGAVLRWCNLGQLDTAPSSNEVKGALQSALGDPTFELRLQFNETETDNDNITDMARFGTVSLEVTYTTP